MKRIDSLGVGDDVGRSLPGKDERVGLATVVIRVRFVVSAEGGGGRGVRVEARQRKHSPLPKYLGAGCGYSER